MPADRIADILTQCGATVIVDDELASGGRGRTVRHLQPPSPSVPDRPPTSCSPRAPRVGRRVSSARIRRCWPTPRTMRCTSCDRRPTRLSHPLRVAHAWSFTFDAAWQPLAALLDGHSVHIVDDDVQRDAEALVETIARHGIDLIDTTPSMFAQLHAVGLLTTVPLGVLALGGEAIGTRRGTSSATNAPAPAWRPTTAMAQQNPPSRPSSPPSPNMTSPRSGGPPRVPARTCSIRGCGPRPTAYPASSTCPAAS